MKLTGFILLFFGVVPVSLQAQYFFTGEVRDPHGDRLENVSIVIKSTGYTRKTGIYGDFRILSDKMEDTLTFLMDGYQPYSTAISTTGFLQVNLRTVALRDPFRNRRLSYISPPAATPPAGSSALVENPFIPQTSAISIPGSINRSSYNIVNRFLDMGFRVPPDAIKIEEMLNYFNFYYEEPNNKDLFHCSSDLFSCPWNPAHKLLCLDICARKSDTEKDPASSLVFLIDASGSMDMPNKLPLLKSAFHLMVKNLRDKDIVSIVVYGRNTGVLLEGAPGSEKDAILRAIEGIRPDGPTPGETGIRLAYEVARQQFIPEGNNKVIVVTDGNLNEGISTENELASFIDEKSQAGIHLSCMSLGMHNAKNCDLAPLAEAGKGNFANIEEEEDAEKWLMSEGTPVKQAVAENMCITTTFNQALVKEYRLLGFENKSNVLADTAIRLEGSMIGSAHSVRALFELAPKEDSTGADTIADVRINYCLPGQKALKTMIYHCENNPLAFDKADNNARKAACIAMLGLKMKGSGYTAQLSWTEIERMVKKTFTGNYYMDREYVALMAKAKRIYENKKGTP
ncbi:MAG TPA: von Willebrand factor type A domain-containing protein [Puia sp.]